MEIREWIIIKKKDFISWLIVFIGTLFIFLLLAVFAMWLFKIKLNIWDKDIYVGLIAYSGAIIGGLFTLLGVYFTLKSTARIKEENEIPKKIHRLENAMEQVLRTINMLAKSEIEFIKIGNEKKLYNSNSREEILEAIPNNLKKEMIYIDSNCYKSLLKMKANLIGRIAVEYYQDIQVELDGLHMEISEHISYPSNINIMVQDMIPEHKDRFREIRIDTDDANHEMQLYAKKQYEDFYVLLMSKHEYLLKELD